MQHSPPTPTSEPPPDTRQHETLDAEGKYILLIFGMGWGVIEFDIHSHTLLTSALPAGKSKPKVGKGKGDKGKSKTGSKNEPPGAQYSFTQIRLSSSTP